MSTSTNAALLEAPDDLDAINRLYRERKWSEIGRAHV